MIGEEKWGVRKSELLAISGIAPFKRGHKEKSG